jgi:hypothetical protein
MLKKLLFLVLAVVFSANLTSAQPGGPCDPAIVTEAQNSLIAQGFDCLVNAGPFTCVDEVINFALSNCPPDTTGWDPCDANLVNQVQNDLIAQGFECLVGAGPFACTNDVIDFALANCPPGGNGGTPCDPITVAAFIDDMIAQGFDCLVGAGPFACVEEVAEYAFNNCPLPIDTTGGDPCDPTVVAQCQNDLIAQGFDCLLGAGPFECLENLFEFAITNCPPDSSGWNPCDSNLVYQVQNDLIAQGFECLVGAGPFTCVDEVVNYAIANCPQDSTGWGNPCDSNYVNQLQYELIAEGFDCLVGAGPFACAEDVFNYAFTNCPQDSTGWNNPCDPVFVSQVQNDLIAQGFECLVDAGPFACVEDVINFAFENCSTPIDTLGDCDPVAVEQAIADLLAQGYTCLDGAGPFTCVHEVVCYALDNCPLPYDTTGIPACMQNIPASVTTFQQFINYLVACDSVWAAEIPACWFTAPTFATDEEFIEWITVNCGFDSLMNNGNEAAKNYFGTQSVSGTNDVKAAFDVQISPNPASTAINIRLKEGEITRIELFDINGRAVLVQNNIANAQANVNLSGVAAGMYMVRIYNADNGVVTSRIVKQ